MEVVGWKKWNGLSGIILFQLKPYFLKKYLRCLIAIKETWRFLLVAQIGIAEKNYQGMCRKPCDSVSCRCVLTGKSFYVWASTDYTVISTSELQVLADE